ncbi:MAG: hypothetical protein NVSMB64_00950 [Candidatus Velthaea sp.]
MPDRIADRENSGHVGAQGVVDMNPSGRRRRDTGSGKIDRIGVGLATGREQYVVRVESALDAIDLGADVPDHLQTLSLKIRRESGADIRVFVRKHAIAAKQNGDGAAEAREHLGELHPDGTGSDDGQPRGEAIELYETRTGEISRAGRAGYQRCRRLRPG